MIMPMTGENKKAYDKAYRKANMEKVRAKQELVKSPFVAVKNTERARGDFLAALSTLLMKAKKDRDKAWDKYIEINNTHRAIELEYSKLSANTHYLNKICREVLEFDKYVESLTDKLKAHKMRQRVKEHFAFLREILKGI